MPNKRKKLRVTVLSEDTRSARFIRGLLVSLGFDRKKMNFDTAPTGRGAAEKWVLRRYPEEVRALRRRNYQRGLRLVAIRDGDRFGVEIRKQEMNAQLESEGLEPRTSDERIAVLIPTWSIETWLLALLGEDDVDEERSLKLVFEHRSGAEEQDMKLAVAAWRDINEMSLPSLRDAAAEVMRLDP